MISDGYPHDSIRFHIWVPTDTGGKKRRTSISLPGFMCELLALKIGVDPADQKAHERVRSWLQRAADKRYDGFSGPTPRMRGINPGTSKMLRNKVLEYIVEPRLLKQHWHFWFKYNEDDYDPGDFDVPIVCDRGDVSEDDD
jgi:hypothetical protein